MDARTTHLVALVEGGATLEQAGEVYGLGRERVRQILKKEGVTVRRGPSKGRPAPLPDRLAAYRQLGPAAEALWRNGMLYADVAEVFGMPVALARELVCERVPCEKRAALIARKFEGIEVTADQMLTALREAAEVLGRTPSRPEYERLRAQGLVEGPDGARISQRLGWAKACERAGLESFNGGVEGNRRPSHRACAKAMTRVSEMLGAAPTYVQYRAYRDPEEPTTRHICTHYGGWINACARFLGGADVDGEQAGPGKTGVREDLAPEDADHAATSGPARLEARFNLTTLESDLDNWPRNLADLADELERFTVQLRAGGATESMIRKYVQGPRMFVSWLAGDYAPGQRGGHKKARAERAAALSGGSSQMQR